METMLDKEWVNLIVQAKQIGIPIGEVRTFLQHQSVKEISQLENKR